MENNNKNTEISNVEVTLEAKKNTDFENKQNPTKRVKEKKTVKKKPVSTFKKVLRGILFFVIVIFLFVVLFNIWNRWFRYDDAADIRSVWQLDGTSSSIEINNEVINLGKNAKFEYTIDSGAKLIKFKIGTSEGCSRYRFSDDRKSVAIFESSNYNAVFSVFDDIKWYLDCFACSINGYKLSPASTVITKEENKQTNIQASADIDLSKTVLLNKIS